MEQKKIIPFPTKEQRLEKTLEPVAPIFNEADEEREVSVEKEIGGPASALPYLEGKERERIQEERTQEEEMIASTPEGQKRRMEQAQEVKKLEEDMAASTPEKDLERKREEDELQEKLEEQKK